MPQLKRSLIFFSVVLLFGAATGIQSMAIPESGIAITHFRDLSGVIVTKLNTLGRIKALLLAAFLVLAAYGIHRRVFFIWQLLGLAVLAGSLATAISALTFSLQLPPPENWIASSALVIGICSASIYWALWWKRQNIYFTSSR